MITAWLYDGTCVLIQNSKFYGADFKWHELTQLYTEIQPPLGGIVSFDGETWSVIEPLPPQQIDILSVKQQAVQKSKEQLAIWLEQNPLLSIVHGGVEASYTVTEEKQALLTTNLMLAQLKQSTTTTWNSQGGICEEWTVQELSQLALEIESYVRPRIKKQQAYEVQINACETVEEVNSIEIEYETIS